MGNILKREKSQIWYPGPWTVLRPTFPNDPKAGSVNAQALTQDVCTRVRSAASPPREMVSWQLGSGLAGTGPALKESLTRAGREWPPELEELLVSRMAD